MVTRLLVLLVAAIATVSAGCGPIQFVVGVTPGDMRMQTTVVEESRGNDRVAIIDVTGLIMNAESPSILQPGENPVSVFHEQLAHAANDARVKAVILRINSPGGGVTASDLMYRDVKRFREVTGKPVVALLMDVAASGGYYLACSSDEVVAYPTSITGSIGVIVQTISFKRGLDRIGVDAPAITSGPNKDVASPFNTLSDEHRAILQGLVDDYYARFVDVVKSARPNIPANQLAAVTDGRVFSGDEAVRVGLADAVGDLHDAKAAAMRRAGIESADLVRYHRPLEYVATPYARAPAPGTSGSGPTSTQINLLQLNVASLSGLDMPLGAYYLWRPDLN